MSDYNDMVKLLNTKLPTAIIKYPTGKYGVVGSMPIELTEDRTSGYGKVKGSKLFTTELEVINALLGVGITNFQLSDSSWYKES